MKLEIPTVGRAAITAGLSAFVPLGPFIEFADRPVD
jgi:hypothetical protein